MCQRGYALFPSLLVSYGPLLFSSRVGLRFVSCSTVRTQYVSPHVAHSPVKDRTCLREALAVFVGLPMVLGSMVDVISSYALRWRSKGGG